MARSADCKCESNFTCGHCLRNAKPWHFTCSSGAVIPAVPVDLQRPAARANYHCWAPGKPFPADVLSTETSFDARKAYAARHGLHPLDVISRRCDCIDDKWLAAAEKHARSF